MSRIPRATLVLALAACTTSEPESVRPPQMREGFFASDDGIRLAYRLELPAGRPPFPAFVIGHGSGRLNRTTAEPIARGLLERGFAVLRYDKRGVGQSEGEYTGVGVANDTMITRLAYDMAAGVALLRDQPEIDDDGIGVGGISQAGWIVPVAAELSGARFALILVGSAMPLGVNMQFERLNRESDSSPSDLALIAAKYDGPLGFDPIPVHERLSIPTYWVFAGQDRSVPTPLCLARIDSLRARSPKDYEIEVFRDAGHDVPGSPAIWPGIERWLNRVTRR
jgi:pimeloyl-ACP methyl ester carboxylesterase